MNNGGPGGPIALAPGVLQQQGNLISADFLGTRTRDLSASRRKLLRAWCRKVLGTY